MHIQPGEYYEGGIQVVRSQAIPCHETMKKEPWYTPEGRYEPMHQDLIRKNKVKAA